MLPTQSPNPPLPVGAGVQSLAVTVRTLSLGHVTLKKKNERENLKSQTPQASKCLGTIGADGIRPACQHLEKLPDFHNCSLPSQPWGDSHMARMALL